MRFDNSETQKSKSYFNILSETYEDFAENTSIHGLKYTVSAEVGFYERVFWILVTIFGLCGAAYMTVLFWERYTSNPTRTTVLTAYAPTTAIPFPAITICNLDVVILPKVDIFMKKLSYNESDESVLRNAILQLSSLTKDITHFNMTEMSILQIVLEQNNYFNLTTVMEEIGQNCSDMLVQCSWNTEKISCNDNFHKSFSHSGICCSFNYDTEQQYPTLYNKYSGLGTGLRVLLNPEVENIRQSHIHSAGFKVIVHYPSVYAGHQSASRISIAGKIFYLQILGKKLTCSEQVKKLPISQRHCLYPNELNLRYFGKKYNDGNCLMECEEALYFKLCGCVPYYLSFSDKPVCNISKIPCLQYLKMDEELSEQFEKCTECLNQCEDITYQMLSTSTKLQYEKDSSLISLDNITDLSTYTLLNVFFLSNVQTVLNRDTTTSTIYLLSSFGGVYSLFLGCSLMTIAEIIYYGCFRFLVNLKLFGRIKTELKDGNKRRSEEKGFSNHPDNKYFQNSFKY